jgi:hypothetical protein
MAEAIAADFSDAQQCNDIDMIKFLFAFCLSGGAKAVPDCDERLLGRAFEEARKLANRREAILETQLSALCVPQIKLLEHGTDTPPAAAPIRKWTCIIHSCWPATMP